MAAYRSSSSALQPSDGARRYFQQFLGETTPLGPADASLVSLIEPMDKDVLLQTGERAYQAAQNLARGAASQQNGTAALFPNQPPLTLAQARTAFYIALVNAVAHELDIESPATVREQRGVVVSDALPGIAHDHLVLVARFSLDVMQSPRLPDTFKGVADMVVDRLGTLVELASQAMMGADVDPFETFEYADCERCGHLLQLHVGFETWEDVRAEHARWCPGAKA
jgi:hypothetical protein